MSQKQQVQNISINPFQNGEKVKSGRKKKEETSRYLQTPMNPYCKVYQKLMRYLDSIGLIHGLCFTAQLRRSLKQFNKFPDIEWKEANYGWYYVEELSNLRSNRLLMRRIRRVMFALKAKCRRLRKKAEQTQAGTIEPTFNMNYNTLEKWTFNKVVDFIIRPGEMVDPQCRQQFYNLNVTLLESIFTRKVKGKSRIKEFALRFFESSLYFSRRFTVFKKKNWIQIKRCPAEQIDKHFIKMFSFFRKNYEDILFNFYEWDDYNQDMKVLFDEEAFKIEEIRQERQVPK